MCVFGYLHVFVCDAECCSLAYATNTRVKIIGQLLGVCPCLLSCLRQSPSLPLYILVLLIHKPPGVSHICLPSFCRSSGIKIYTPVLGFTRVMFKFEIITSWEVNEITLEIIVLSTLQLEVLANVISFTSQNVIISNLNLKELVKNSSKGR